MAAHSVLMLVIAFKRDADTFVRQHPHAFLIASPIAGEKPIKGTGLFNLGNADGCSGDPVAHEIVKAGNVANAFAFGVTIGHAENNDIVLRHPDVSRFHAFIQLLKGKNHIVDAGSRNGTTVDERRLEPSKPWPLPAKVTLGFGAHEVTYVEPAAFGSWYADYTARTKSAPK